MGVTRLDEIRDRLATVTPGSWGEGDPMVEFIINAAADLRWCVAEIEVLSRGCEA